MNARLQQSEAFGGGTVRHGSWKMVAAILGAAGALIMGCGSDAPELPQPGVFDDAPTETGDLAARDGIRRSIKGLCVVGHEVRTFIPCGSKTVYWIQADQASLDAFQVAIERFTDEPFEPFYAEIDGRLSDEQGDGFAADYDGQFFVDRLIHLAPAGELDCDG